MVVFTCNHCGDSVKKPSVVKHYATKCRGNSIFLTCMDCQKDFKEKEHDAHTKCISEAEKYSGKNYVPKPGQNKGQKKQDNWIETIRALSTNKDKVQDPKLRSVFLRLNSFENIPRKKAKFQNFVTNSFKIPMSVAMKVWNVLEKELQESKTSKEANENKENEIEKSDSHQENENWENTDDKGIDFKQTSNATDSEIDKKKSKRTKDSQNNHEGVDLDNNEPSKKKKKKNKAEEVNGEEQDFLQEGNGSKNGTIDDGIETIAVTNGESRKRKKKDQAVEIEGGNMKSNKKSLQNGIDKKKSKKNKIVSNDINQVDHVNDDEESIKKKKIKNDGNIEASNLKIANNKFDWFLYINKCASDGMNVSKLKEKVLKKFKKQNPESEITNKVEKTFRKYLKKSGLILLDDIVKIDS